MLKVTVRNASIKGIATVVPPLEMRLADDTSLYGGDAKQLSRVMKSSGFDRRRVAEADVTAADLCEEAARVLLGEMKIDPASIDAIVFVSQTPDYLMPATACVLQHRLGLTSASAAFDVNQGCAGYPYGLWIAGMMLGSGCRRVLFLAGDTPSKYTDMFSAQQSAPIFGDAGSATLLEYEEGASPWFFDIGTDGGQFDAIIARNGGFRNPPRPEMFDEAGHFLHGAQMDGLRVMAFTLSKVPESILAVLDYAGVDKDQIDYFVFHQANKLILENIAFNTKIDPAKMPLGTLSAYGNQSCASIPGALCDALQSQLGEKKLTLCLSGFGIGLSWASMVLETNKIYCSGVRSFREKS